MKTPEQIADDAMRNDKGDDVTPGEWWRGSCEEMRQIIVTAIEADRAQRPTPLTRISRVRAAVTNLDTTLQLTHPGEGWAMPAAHVERVFAAAEVLIAAIREVDTAPQSDGLKLRVEVERDATLEEVQSLIWGTGALVHSWWGGVTQEGESFTFQHDDEDSEEGALDVRTTVTAADILDAAGRRLSGAVASSDQRDAIQEDIGYLDADEADCVLQLAVLHNIIFG